MSSGEKLAKGKSKKSAPKAKTVKGEEGLSFLSFDCFPQRNEIQALK